MYAFLEPLCNFLIARKAFVFLFQSSGTGTSRYDTIADLHRIAVDEAHGGPNFLPWHRLYLLM